jgi:pimeloyl-ACP methyl ester carboxylesterase
MLLICPLVEVRVTGLGSLINRVADASSANYAAERVSKVSNLPTYNLEITCGGVGLSQIGDKLINVKKVGNGVEKIVFVHGLGGTAEYYTPLIEAAGLKDNYTCYLYDLEGHGLTPTKSSSVVTMDSFAEDLAGIFAHAGITSGGILVGHSLGCLIAMTFAVRNPSLVKKLILTGPGASPFPAAASEATYKRAAAVRAQGMLASGVIDAVSNAGTSAKTKLSRPVSYAAVRSSLLSNIPEGYAKACMALAGSKDTEIEIEKLTMETLIITGDEDKVSPVELVKKMQSRMKNAKVETVNEVGHWHIYEDAEAVARAVKAFL